MKNRTLDLLKLFAAYMVVFIHVPFYGEMSVIVDALGRFAVPLFFLVSGFYSYGISAPKIKKRIQHIFCLLILATVCHTLFNICTHLFDNDLAAYLGQYADYKALLKLFLLNVTISAPHLWYLLAILYVYAAFYLVTHFRTRSNVIYITAFSLLLLQLLLGEGLSAFGIALPTGFVRNFVLMGIPCFALGLFAKKYQHKFRTVPHPVIFAALLLGIAESLLSRYLFGKNELYLGSLLILFALVCVFNRYSHVRYPTFLMTLSGGNTYIYIFHIIIATMLSNLYAWCGVQSSMVVQILHPILACIVSTAFALCIVQIKTKRKKK